MHIGNTKNCITFIFERNSFAVWEFPERMSFTDSNKTNAKIKCMVEICQLNIYFTLFDNIVARKLKILKILYFSVLYILKPFIFSPKIDSSGSSLQNIHFFNPDKVNNASVCHVDISVKPDIPGNHSLCLTPREGV